MRRTECIWIFGAALSITAHWLFLMSYFEPAYSTPDAHSYYFQAKLLATKQHTWFVPESPMQYIGHHWRRNTAGRYYCVHAPGLAVILAPVYRLLGPQATLYVSPLLTSLSLLGLFLLCRLWVGSVAGLIAVVFMAVNPFANEHALFGDANCAAAFFLVWSMYFLALWDRARKYRWVFLAGLFAGTMVTIRYPEALYLPAMIGFVALSRRDGDPVRLSLSSILALVTGMAVPLVPLMVRNHLAFGAFWRTGYSLAFETSSFFGLRCILQFFPRYLQLLLNDGAGIVLPLGILGIALMIAHQTHRAKGLLLAALIGPITLLYMAYFWGPDRQSMRYFIPTFYLYCLAAVWLLSQLVRHWGRLAWIGPIVLLIVNCCWGLPHSCQALRSLRRNNAALATVTEALQRYTTAGSILITYEGLNQYLDFVGRWRLTDLILLRAGQIELGPPGPAQPHPRLRSRIRLGPNHTRPYEGLTGSALWQAIGKDLADWAKRAPDVYLLARQPELRPLLRHLPQGRRFVPIAMIDLLASTPSGPRSFTSPRPPVPPQDALSAPVAPPAPGPYAGPHPADRLFDFALDNRPLQLLRLVPNPD